MILTIKCFDTTVYRLEFPGWFYSAEPNSTKKILKWALQFSWKNKETIDTLKSLMPTLKDETLKHMAEEEQHIRAEQEMSVRRAQPEDKADVRRFYAAKLRRLRKYPQTAQTVMDFWNSEVQRCGY